MFTLITLTGLNGNDIMLAPTSILGLVDTDGGTDVYTMATQRTDPFPVRESSLTIREKIERASLAMVTGMIETGMDAAENAAERRLGDPRFDQ